MKPGWKGVTACRGSIWIMMLPLVFFLVLATWEIESPGIEYDEVLFGNASLGIQDHSFVAWTLPLGSKNIPVMLMPYIGALKAYLYYPILRLFGADPMALRLPAVLTGALALLLYTAIARRIIGSRGALVFALLLATDPSYIYHVRLDWGPVALMLLFKAAGAYLFLRWWETRSRWSLALSGLSLGLGVFDKANFVWFPLAAGMAAIIVYRRQLLARMTVGAATIFAVSFVLGALPLLLYNVAFPLVTLREPFEASDRLLAADSLRRLGVVLETLLGVAVFKFVNMDDVQALWTGYAPWSASDAVGGLPSFLVGAVTSSPLGRGSLLAPLLLVALAYLGAGLLTRSTPWARAAVALTLTSLFIILQLLITRKASGSYHVMMLYPLPHLLVAMAVVDLWGVVPARFPRIVLPSRRVAASLAVVAVVASNLLIDVGYLRYFSAEGGKGIWSSAIYDLVEYAQERPSNRLVLLDWGFNTQLLTISRGSIQKDEVYQWLTLGQSERQRFDSYLQDPGSLYLFHSSKHTQVPQPREIFSRLLEEKGLREEVVKTFYQRNGEPVYFVSRVTSG